MANGTIEISQPGKDVTDTTLEEYLKQIMGDKQSLIEKTGSVESSNQAHGLSYLPIALGGKINSTKVGAMIPLPLDGTTVYITTSRHYRLFYNGENVP